MSDKDKLPAKPPSPVDVRFRYVNMLLTEFQRRTNSGHLRAQLLAAGILGWMALCGGSFALPVPIPAWGPISSLALAILSFVQLMVSSLPHRSWKDVVRKLPRIKPPAEGEEGQGGETYQKSLTIGDEQTLVVMGDDVDFLKVGVRNREVQYMRSLLLLVISFVPMVTSLIIGVASRP